MDEISNKKIHVLALPSPLQGHINPMVHFSKCLVSRRVNVTIFTLDFVCMSMLSDCNGSLINIESIPHDESPPNGNIDDLLEWYQVQITNNFRAIVEKFSDVKVLIFDSLASWIIDLAHQLGLKVAAFSPIPCAPSAIYYHMHPETSKIPLDGSTLSLPSLPLLEKEDLPSFVYQHRDLHPTIARLFFGLTINLKKADWLLFNTFDVLENEVINWLRTQYSIKTIGPTFLTMYLDKQLKDVKENGLSPSGETCIKWLDLREIGSVIYVSFGSLASLGEKQMEELASGLLMTNCYFLWIVRTSEVHKLPKEFMSKLSKKGLIVNWCAQLDVLAHKSVGCFFTHCGWNSTLESLSLGVPMVGMPQWADEPTNVKFIMDIWQTGIRVKAGKDGIITREVIASSIKEIMEGGKGVMLKENAIKWKQLAKEAINEGGSSNKNIEEFIQSLYTK
nr:UDP glycosyltransferase 9-like [Nicotiana tomentosiformis]